MTQADATAHRGIADSARSIITGLILTGVLSLVGLVWQQGRESAQAREDSARADAARAVQIATLQAQVAEVQRALAGVPEMSQRVARLEAAQGDLLRRQAESDAWRERFDARHGR